MSDNDFDLNDLRTVISEKYKPAQIGIGEGRSVKLQQIARLSDEKQEALLAMQEEFKDLRTEGSKLNAGAQDVTPEQVAEWKAGLDYEPSAEQVDEYKAEVAGGGVTHEKVKAYKRRTIDVLERMLKLVAVNDDDGDALISACNHDELLLMEVFTRYSKRTKLGEASASPSSSETTAGPSSTTSESFSDSTSGQ